MSVNNLPTEAQVDRAIQEREYYEFFKAAWPILEPTTPLQDNWHIKYLCDTLQTEIERIAAGLPKTTDIIINVPPRSLKSSIVTVSLNAWAWTRWPHLKFISGSYAANIALELGLKTRRLVDSPWYQENWGARVKFSQDQNSKELFENTNHGLRKSVGVGGGVTGSGADVFIIDDPQNPEEAHSEADRKTCIRWFKETAYSRLNNQDVGLRVVIMQRLHQEDLTGWILENQPGLWRHICLPVSTEFQVRPASAVRFYKGGLFFPARFTPQIIRQAKVTLGDYGYAGQMGQAPAPIGGGIFKSDWWQRYKILPRFSRRVWSWDTAVKTGEENDWSVGQLWAECENGYYLVRSIRLKLEYPDLLARVQAEFVLDPTAAILIEDKSSGQQLLQSIKKLTKLPIIAMEAAKDKVTRANIITPTVQSGRVFIPESAEWLPAFVSELALFPNGANDDQVDTFVHALIFFTAHGTPSSSWLGAPVTEATNPEWA